MIDHEEETKYTDVMFEKLEKEKEVLPPPPGFHDKASVVDTISIQLIKGNPK